MKSDNIELTKVCRSVNNVACNLSCDGIDVPCISFSLVMLTLFLHVLFET